MKTPQQPSGLTIGLELLINDNWTAEQAWAVVELLDDWRGRIYNHYLIPIQALLCDDHGITEDLQDGQSN